jgi:hypothetical protein
MGDRCFIFFSLGDSNNLQTLWASLTDPAPSDATTARSAEVPLLGRTEKSAADAKEAELFRKRLVFSALAAIPPIGMFLPPCTVVLVAHHRMAVTGLACATRHLDALVSFTGSFAGLAIQSIIPTALVYYSRRR